MHPILFSIGPVHIYTYGALVACAMIVAWAVLSSRAEAYALPRAKIMDLVVFLFLAGILGARLLFVLQHVEDYSHSLWKIFMIQEGGLVWYGGFFFAVLMGIFFARMSHLPLFRTADCLAPAIALAHAVGRIGCYLNGCCYGINGHPVQLYEAAGLFVLGIALMRLTTPRFISGSVFLCYVLGYSLLRFVLEYWRGDQLRLYWFTLPQWTSILLFLGAALLLKALRRHR